MVGLRGTDHPQAGALMSSDTPKDMEPMKSFLVVRSQSHTSTDNLRSLSIIFSLLGEVGKAQGERTHTNVHIVLKTHAHTHAHTHTHILYCVL